MVLLMIMRICNPDRTAARTTLPHRAVDLLELRFRTVGLALIRAKLGDEMLSGVLVHGNGSIGDSEHLLPRGVA
jgi:hypothetical protein